MKKLSPDLPVRRQLNAHAAALLLLLAAVFLPQVSHVAGAAVTIEFGWLLHNLSRIILAWRRAGGRWRATRRPAGEKYV